MTDQRSRTSAGRSCPYCRFTIKANVPVVECPACVSVHHAECWQDNGGCSTMGCANAPAAPQPKPSHDEPTRVHSAAPFAATTEDTKRKRWLLPVGALALAVAAGAGTTTLLLSGGKSDDQQRAAAIAAASDTAQKQDPDDADPTQQPTVKVSSKQVPTRTTRPAPSSRSSSSTTQSSSSAASATRSAAFSRCDANISVRDGATCRFAQNTFWVYYLSGGASSLNPYSSAARRTLETSCSQSSALIICTAEDGGTVRFSRASVDAYSDEAAWAYAESTDVGGDSPANYGR